MVINSHHETEEIRIATDHSWNKNEKCLKWMQAHTFYIRIAGEKKNTFNYYKKRHNKRRKQQKVSMWQRDILLHFVWVCVCSVAVFLKLNFNIFQPEFQCSMRLANFFSDSGRPLYWHSYNSCVRLCAVKFVVQIISWYSIKWRNYQHY